MVHTLNLNQVHSDSHTRRALADLSLSVAKSKRIVVVTGAGISCSSGIPDFRSSDGLYAMVKQQYPDVVLKGRDLFDAALFRDSISTAIFFTFISQLKRSIHNATPTATHNFIKTLDTKKKLLRSYTQNIDGLEDQVGLLSSSSKDALAGGKGKSKINTKEVRNVQLHGDIHRVRCTACSAEYPCTDEHLNIFEQGTSPECPECLERSKARVARSARAIKVGTLRPAIVLYDEPHPLGDDIGTIQTADLAKKPEMLVIMGTSLKVHGLKKLVKEFAKAVHAQGPSQSSPPAKGKKAWAGKVVFVNRTPPGAEWSGIIDYHVAGETDAWVEKVVEDWKKARPADWEMQQTLPAEVFKPVAAGTSKAKSKGKKPIRDEEEENIPPPSSSFDMVLSTSDRSPAAGLFKPVSAPSSPSKRRQNESHYNKLQSSPSKKRVMSGKIAVPSELQTSLFGKSANVVDDDDSIADLSMQDLTMNSPPKTKRLTRTRTNTVSVFG